MKSKFLLCIISVFSSLYSYSQFIEVGGSLGYATYQGDISFSSSRLSVQGAKFLDNLHLGFQFNEYYTVKFRYSRGSIGAYDSYSLDSWRTERNLHFRSEIREFALIHELELFDVIKYFRKIRLKPFINIGLAWFTFNPQANYLGKWVDLQPLSTEGQGTSQNDTPPYSLSQISIPFGFGFKYNINPNWYVSIEISPRITFTDYLDDVSNKYPDLSLLRSEKGEISAALSHRGNIPLEEVSRLRGNPRDNDWYIFNNFTIGYQFNIKEYFKRRKSFRYGRKCHFL